MSSVRNKYSLWITPKGEVGTHLQQLVTTLAGTYHAPDFAPHVTLVANIFASDSELISVRQKISDLAAQVSTCRLTFTGYGYKDETFRSLYLLVESPELHSLYEKVASVFPQVKEEQFASMPHLSILYGNYQNETKEIIIHQNPFAPITYTVDSFDLHMTNDPVSSWKHIERFPIDPSQN